MVMSLCCGVENVIKEERTFSRRGKKWPALHPYEPQLTQTIDERVKTIYVTLDGKWLQMTKLTEIVCYCDPEFQ